MTPREQAGLVTLLSDDEVVQTLRTPMEAVCTALEAFGFRVQPLRSVTREQSADRLLHCTETRFDSAADGVALHVRQVFDIAADGAARLYVEIRSDIGEPRLRQLVLSSAGHAGWSGKKHGLAILKGELDVVRFFVPHEWAPAAAAGLVAQLQP